MSTFIMLGNYTAKSLDEMSSERTMVTVNLVKSFGGEIKDMYALLGQNDILIIADFPSTEKAMKASIAINKSTGISFVTSPAVTVEEYDQLINEV
jgi:uncharacterized protein with GYD domain